MNTTARKPVSGYLNRPLRSLAEVQADHTARDARAVRGAIAFQIARFTELRAGARNPALRANFDQQIAELAAVLLRMEGAAK
jgi:hypothetical protein